MVVNNHTLWKHPTSQTSFLLASLLYYQISKNNWVLDSNQMTFKWIIDNLSRNGLLYEEYYLKTHSVQEDVFPSASFAQDCLIL